MEERDLQVVRDYYNKMLKINDVRILGQKQELERRSYARFAIEQIMDRVAFELLTGPDYISGYESLSLVEVVSEFIDEMTHCMETATRDSAKRIFDIARTEARLFLYDYLEGRQKCAISDWQQSLRVYNEL